MLKKRSGANALMEKLHRGAVYTCIGVTICSTFLLGMRLYHYYTVIKPERKKAELQMIIEGSHDKATELKS